MIDRKDFSNLREFPGTTGNPFDTVLHRAVDIEKIPAPVFAPILLFIAILPHFGSWIYSLVIWLFFLMDWALLAALPRTGKSFGPAKPTVLVLAVLRIFPALLPIAYAVPIEVLGTILVVYGFWIEPHRINVTRQVYRSAKYNGERPIKILHIGDLHVERITNRERQLNQLVHETKPDLILFSGDFINLSYLNDPAAWQAVRDIVGEWSAPLGVFAVSGSPAVDLPDIMPGLLDGLPIRWLKNEKVILDHADECLQLIGVTCTHKPFEDAPHLNRLADGKDSQFTILLYHSPDLAPEAALAGIDLQLSGHTHGGQVRLPFYGALFTGSLYGKRFESGRIPVGDMILYVTRGVGLEGCAAPRVRFLCPPEVILWEIDGIKKE